MSAYEFGHPRSKQERDSSLEIIGNYPYGNLSVSGMARVLTARIERNQLANIESALAIEAELSDALDAPEAEAA